MDSYDVVDFVMSVEKHFNIAVDDSQVMALKSISDVKNIIDQYNKED
jgi:acyl carrier protein